MKKAKIILVLVSLLAAAGGVFSYNTIKAMRNMRPAYTYTGGITWTSTTIGIKIYSTTIPVCVTLSILGKTAYVTNVGIPAADVYTTANANTIFTTTTAVGGPTVSTTLPITICNTHAPLTNTLATTLQ
ncbi:hypothetical protein [Chitinophaga agri]|uniref:Uncharacterized protein n=1 Tax=Chitinophaga agri TaxID=2703787 RepID=A0A6B9ZK89_9BACT|nr:hypothetical protein [Chitinophaga agri]QHS61043.1 hypothetical protein GWR21_15985 [Chitinophaga agri]